MEPDPSKRHALEVEDRNYFSYKSPEVLNSAFTSGCLHGKLLSSTDIPSENDGKRAKNKIGQEHCENYTTLEKITSLQEQLLEVQNLIEQYGESEDLAALIVSLGNLIDEELKQLENCNTPDSKITLKGVVKAFNVELGLAMVEAMNFSQDTSKKEVFLQVIEIQVCDIELQSSQRCSISFDLETFDKLYYQAPALPDKAKSSDFESVRTIIEPFRLKKINVCNFECQEKINFLIKTADITSHGLKFLTLEENVLFDLEFHGNVIFIVHLIKNAFIIELIIFSLHLFL
jgi:hypothetical protein